MPEVFDPFAAPSAEVFDPFASLPSETTVSEIEVTAPRPETVGQRARGVGRAVGEGLLFGFEDRLEAMLRTGSISGAQYKAMRDKIRQEQGDYAAKHPLEAGTLEIGGAVLPSLALLAVPGVGEVAGASTLAKVGRLAAIGAGEGALQGAGSSDKLLSTEGALKTLEGAGLGTVFSLGAGALPTVARKTKGTLAGLFTRPSEAEATRKALEITAKALKRQGKNAAEVEAELTRLRDRNIPATLGDVGTPNVAREVMRTPSGGKLAAETATRQSDAGERVRAQVSDTVTKGASYDVEREAVVKRLRSNADTLYQKAFAQGDVDDAFINNIIGLDEMRTFWTAAMGAAERDAAVTAAKTGKPPINPLRDYLVPQQRASGVLDIDGKPMMVTEYVPSGEKVPTVQVLDWLKRGMDESIDKGFRAGNMSAKAAKDFREIRDEMTSRLDVLAPDYKIARAAFKGDAEIRDAFDMGMGQNMRGGEKAVDRMRTPELEAWATTASNAEKEAAFTGYGNFLLEQIVNSPKANPAALVGSTNRLARLRTLARDPAEMDLLETALKRENELFTERSGALKGVSEAARRAAQEDMDLGIATGNAELISAALRSGSVPFFSGLALRIIGREGAGQSPEVLAKLADIMRRGTPDEIATTVASLGETEGRLLAQGKQRSVLNQAMAVAGATLVGPEEPPGGKVEEQSFEVAPEEAPLAEQGDEVPPPPAPPTTADEAAAQDGDQTLSLGERNNNLGNLKAIDYYQGSKPVLSKFTINQPGYQGYDDRGFAIFDTVENGTAAQERLLARNYNGKTISQIVQRYTKGDPEKTQRAYMKYLAGQLGLGVNDIPRDIAALAAAMRRFETGGT